MGDGRSQKAGVRIGRRPFWCSSGSKSRGARPRHPHPSRGGRRELHPPTRHAFPSPGKVTGEGNTSALRASLHRGRSCFPLPLKPLQLKQSFQGRSHETSLSAIARRPVESSRPARGPGAAAARQPRPQTAAAHADGCHPRHPLAPRPLRTRHLCRCRAQASLVPRLDPTALPSLSTRKDPLGRASG